MNRESQSQLRDINTLQVLSLTAKVVHSERSYMVLYLRIWPQMQWVSYCSFRVHSSRFVRSQFPFLYPLSIYTTFWTAMLLIEQFNVLSSSPKQIEVSLTCSYPSCSENHSSNLKPPESSKNNLEGCRPRPELLRIFFGSISLLRFFATDIKRYTLQHTNNRLVSQLVSFLRRSRRPYCITPVQLECTLLHINHRGNAVAHCDILRWSSFTVRILSSNPVTSGFKHL